MAELNCRHNFVYQHDITHPCSGELEFYECAKCGEAKYERQGDKMSKMGEELEKRLDENKYDLYYALKHLMEKPVHHELCQWYSEGCTCGHEGAILEAERAIAKIEGA